MVRYYILVSAVLLTCWRCADFIDVRPENSTTYTNYYRTQDDAEALLSGLMTYMRGVGNSGWIADAGEKMDVDLYYNVPNKLLDYQMSSNWSYFYNVIYQADLIIDNAHRFELTEEELKPYLLQAYFAKGIAYFWLARTFGEVPITQGSTTFEKFPQSSISEVLDEAEKWALMAMDLPVYEEMVSTAGGERMKQFGSKGATAALLAHLYAWRAGVEGKSECWAKAEEYCSMIIDGQVGFYKLVETPEQVCVDVMKGNSDESIWEAYNNIEELDQYCYYNAFVGFPVLTTSSDLPTDDDYRPLYYKTTIRDMYAEGDLRRNAYFWATDADSIFLKVVGGETVADVERGMDSVIIGYDNEAIQRAYFYKYRYPYYAFDEIFMEPMYIGLNQNKVVWRLADIYLLRAECRARQNKANAVEDLNKIRSRAYGDLDKNQLTEKYAFPCADDIAKGLDGNIQLAIFREREKELLQESHRYYDIVRNGWCYMRGEDSYDYIRNEISDAYAALTDQDLEDGALYYKLLGACFTNNDLIRQNRYWNRRAQ